MATKSEINIIKEGNLVVTLFKTGGEEREEIINWLYDNINEGYSNEAISNSIVRLLADTRCYITSVRGIADIVFNLFIEDDFANLHIIEPFD